MSGWSTITFEQDIDVSNTEKDHDYLIDSLENYAKERDLNVAITRYHGNPVIMIGGYRDWDVDEKILKHFSNLWEKAVVCQANDTSDTGHAKYYEKSTESDIYDTGEVMCLDEFEEKEIAHGRPVGAKACAYMTLHHGVYCLSSLNRPRTYNKRFVPNRNEKAFKELRKAWSRWEILHIDDEKIIEHLEKAVEEIKGRGRK